MHGSSGGTGAPSSLPWTGTSNVCPAPCVGRGSHPHQARPTGLCLVVLPCSKSAELRNAVFGGAGKKKERKKKNLVMLKEKSYFTRFPPLRQLKSCSWALCPASSIRQGKVQAGRGAGRARMAAPGQGWYFPGEGQHGVKQPEEGCRAAGGGMRVSVPIRPHSRLPSTSQVERISVPTAPSLPSCLFPHPAPAFHSPVSLQGCGKLNISVYMHIYARTPCFSCSFTHPSLQRPSKLNC